MKFTPQPQQVLAHNFLVSTKYAALFAGMGLGKTASVLSAFTHLLTDGQARGLLVVAPLKVSVLTWPNEVELWDEFSWLKIANLRTKEGVEAWYRRQAHIYTINYESLPKIVLSCFKGVRGPLPADVVLFDELDNAKSPGAKTFRGFRKYSHKFTRRWGMTGTPLGNNWRDIFAQIRLLDEGQRFGTVFGKWQKKHFEIDDPYSDWPQWKVREGAPKKIVETISDMSLVLRTEDWNELPPAIFEDIDVTLSPEYKKLYKKLVKELIHTLQDGFEIVAPNTGVLVFKLMQITSGAIFVTEDDNPDSRRVEHLHDAKLNKLREIALKHREPILVSCQFTHEIDRIVSTIPGAQRFTNDCLDAWNAGDIPMIAAHPKSISHGLNMQGACRRIVWFSVGHSANKYNQFNARVWRLGQKRQCYISHLNVPRTIDDACLLAVQRKRADESEFLSMLKNIIRMKDLL